MDNKDAGQQAALPQLPEHIQKLYDSGDLIGQLRDFFETSGMRDGARRYLMGREGIQILVSYNPNSLKEPVLQIRNVEGLDDYVTKGDGTIEVIKKPLDQWEKFIHYITDPGFKEIRNLCSAIVVSGEADRRISRWCEENGWERIRPTEDSGSIPDNYLFTF